MQAEVSRTRREKLSEEKENSQGQSVTERGVCLPDPGPLDAVLFSFLIFFSSLVPSLLLSPVHPLGGQAGCRRGVPLWGNKNDQDACRRPVQGVGVMKSALASVLKRVRRGGVS